MAALFPPWSNTAIRVAMGLVVLGGGAAVAAPMIYVRTPYATRQFDPVDQPVELDHRHHSQDDGIDCLYCHSGAERQAAAGIPSTDLCMGCHGQVWNDSPALEPVRRSYFSGLPIPWNRVHDLPDFTYFHHGIHVSRGVGCVTCHGRVDEMARVYQVESLSMGWCLDCHRNPGPNLRPLNRITDMAFRPPAHEREELGRRLSAELGVRRSTHCSACHR